MQTVVETLKHHSVNQLQEADMWEVLHCPRLVLEGGKGPRGRGGPPYPHGADLSHSNRAWQQSAAIPLHHTPGQPCSHAEGRKANTQSSYYIPLGLAEQGGAMPHRIFNPSSSAQPIKDQPEPGGLKGHSTSTSERVMGN